MLSKAVFQSCQQKLVEPLCVRWSAVLDLFLGQTSVTFPKRVISVPGLVQCFAQILATIDRLFSTPRLIDMRQRLVQEPRCLYFPPWVRHVHWLLPSSSVIDRGNRSNGVPAADRYPRDAVKELDELESTGRGRRSLRSTSLPYWRVDLVPLEAGEDLS